MGSDKEKAGNGVKWQHDSNEWCEFVVIDNFKLTLRTVNTSYNSLSCQAVLTDLNNWEQLRSTFNGSDLLTIEHEVLAWAKLKIDEINDYVGIE
ncbi:hypothetical protein [Shewanella colwelliana]|uniref:hypothetical protein n=1 Tax=Shewanella colwelliana TaxID=23 RepID=UPI0037360B0B